MELSIIERLLLLGLLPDKGDFTTLKIVRDLQGDLSFSEDEHKAFELVNDAGEVRWNPAKAATKEVAIGPKALVLIEKTLKDMSEKGTLTMQFMEIYEKFVSDN